MSILKISRFAAGAAALLAMDVVLALGTVAGTDIDNTAVVSYQVSGNPVSESSNTLTVTVAELLDVDVTLQSPPVPVSPGNNNQGLLFTVTNTGNGTETYTLALDSAVTGDDFDPTPSAPAAIYFDTDGSGDLSAGDTQYIPGTNDPVLAPDESVDVFLVNDIPGTATDGQIGSSQLDATASTGSGAPGDVFAGGGDTGVDAVVGTSGGSDNDAGDYVVSDIRLDIVKTAAVVDPFGGTEPVPGAEVTYTIVVTPVGSGTATASVFNDPIPANTTFLPGSITLNGTGLTDAPDTDAGQYVSTAVNVDLGDLTTAIGPQTIEFVVTID